MLMDLFNSQITILMKLFLCLLFFLYLLDFPMPLQLFDDFCILIEFIHGHAIFSCFSSMSMFLELFHAYGTFRCFCKFSKLIELFNAHRIFPCLWNFSILMDIFMDFFHGIFPCFSNSSKFV